MISFKCSYSCEAVLPLSPVNKCKCDDFKTEALLNPHHSEIYCSPLYCATNEVATLVVHAGLTTLHYWLFFIQGPVIVTL